MPGFRVDVDDHGLADRLALLGRQGVRTAQRRGVTEAAKYGRAEARGFAPVATGAGRRGISYRVRSRGTTVVGKVYNKVFYMRFQARGTGGRYTRHHAYRGILPADGFMQQAADLVDVAAPRMIDQAIGEALAAAGL